jgi:hypothetical protein
MLVAPPAKQAPLQAEQVLARPEVYPKWTLNTALLPLFRGGDAMSHRGGILAVRWHDSHDAVVYTPPPWPQRQACISSQAAHVYHASR